MLTASAIAHPNIALVKYWGKQEKPGNLPATPNLSITLDGLTTRTTIEEIGEEEIETILMNTLQTMKRLRMPSGMRQEEPEDEEWDDESEARYQALAQKSEEDSLSECRLTEVRHRQTARMYNKWRKFLCS